jgi:Flp pilus assembly protein TadD
MIKSSEICESSEVNYSRGILALWQGGNQRAIDLSRRIESEMKAEAYELRGDAYTNQGYPSDARVEYINAIRYYRCRYYDIERVQKKLLKGEACSD